MVPAGVPGASVGGADRRLLGRAAGERLLQQRADALGAAVLHLIDVEADAAAGVTLVQPLDPFFCFLEVRRLRCDHQQGVHPLDRDDAQNARQRTLVGRSHRLVELGHDGLDLRALQREQAHRHAGQPVDVEHVDGLEHVPELELGAGDDQQVAQIVGAYRRRILLERLEDRHHLAHADVLERHDLDAVARRQRPRAVAELRRDVAANGSRGRHDLPDRAFLDHRRAVRAKNHFQRRRQRLARNARGRAYRYRAADRRIDRVRLAEDIGQDVADDLAQFGAFEVERDRRSARHRARRCRAAARRRAAVL